MCKPVLYFKAHKLLIVLSMLFSVYSQKFYLPPNPPIFEQLPEVIDARDKNPITLLQEINYQPPPLGLQTPYPDTVYPMFRFKSTADERIRTNFLNRESFRDVLSDDVTINEISCGNNGDELYFRASLLPMKNFDEPIIENVSSSSSSSCKILKYQSKYRIEFGKNEFWKCGVIDCSSESGKLYCLSLRFPTISGLRLKDDFKVTLQCRAQEKIASHTRRINLKTIDTAARMAARVATGGHNNTFETDVGLYRKTFGSEHVFDAKIESGGTVVLGEEILLRAGVREGDGWKYSRISEVTVQFLENRQRKKIMSSLWILDSEGCSNPQARDICPGEQYRVENLESYLLFKAFMFQNMRETDEMVLSVKVTGCQNGEDCVLNCPGGHVRKVRDVQAQNKNATFIWQNDITFRVVESTDRIEQSLKQRKVLPFTILFLMLAFVMMLIFGIKIFTRRS